MSSSSPPACRRWCSSPWAASRRPVGAPAWLVWTISVLFGFAQAFIYAEIAGLHPSKTGGTAVHGATAWIRYSQYHSHRCRCGELARLDAGAGHRLGTGRRAICSRSSPRPTPRLTPGSHISSISASLEGRPSLRINATFISARPSCWRSSTSSTAASCAPPDPDAPHDRPRCCRSSSSASSRCFQGNVHGQLRALHAARHRRRRHRDPGRLGQGRHALFLGGLFIAAWSTYGFETAVCYMSEFKNPGRDMPHGHHLCRALFCIFVYVMVPFVFQGVLGTAAHARPRTSTPAPASALALAEHGAAPGRSSPR